MVNIKARRRLSDLYKVGVEVRFGRDPDGKPIGKIADTGEGYFVDGDGKRPPLAEDEVAMWICPPSPLQRDMAQRDAQAARARALVKTKRDENSEEHLTTLAFLSDMSDETLVDYVLLSDTDTRRNDATREVLAEEEWGDLTALQDAMRQFEEMEPEELLDNPEYDAIMELDTKFGDQVRKREEELQNAYRDVLKMAGRASTEKKAINKRADLVGSQAFMVEYEKQMLFYSIRDIDDQGSCFFESARECAEQPDDVRQLIQDALLPFVQDAGEAKNSLGVVSGSDSSEPPSEPETSEASTPEESNA